MKLANVLRIGILLAASQSLLCQAMPTAVASSCAFASKQIPGRAPSARGGTEFAHQVASIGEHDRDEAIRRELLAGNLPAFLRSAVPIQLIGRALGGALTRITLCVLPDYLSVGSDADYVLVPMSLHAALSVARAFGFTLPTRKIVDAIYAQSAVRLQPLPLPASDQMRSTEYFVWHNALVRTQRKAIGAPLGELTAGDKKDLVITNRLWRFPDRVAIYGWHRDEGEPIQPLSTFHGARYADYSHGVRLVSTTAMVEGQPTSIFDVLGSTRLAPILSDEGPLPDLAALQSAMGGNAPVPGEAHH